MTGESKDDQFPLFRDQHEVKFPIRKRKRYVKNFTALFSVLASIFVIVTFLWTFKFIAFSRESVSFIVFVHNRPDDFSLVHTNDSVSESVQTLKGTLSLPRPSLNPLCSRTPEVKFDCCPDSPSEKKCLSRGCCWQPVSKTNFENKETLPKIGIPYCYYPDNFVGYTVLSQKKSKYQTEAVLERKEPSGFPKDVSFVYLQVTYLDETKLRIKLTDANNSRFEVPVPNLSHLKQKSSFEQSYNVVLDAEGNLKVSRKSTGTTIFSTRLSTLVYSDQLIQISSLLPSSYVYGLSEHKGPLLKSTQWNRIVFFNRDRFPIEAFNTYGSHPFYLSMEDDASSHGIFLLNSNSMEIILQPNPAVTFRTIGGILDFFVFLGPSPKEVSQQYINLIGLPAMPPYWGLGFHLCRYGYNSVNETRKVWERTRNAGIPFDVQWNDIDYMERHNDFTYDKINFSGLPEFVDEVHEAGMHYVAMFDPGISGGEPKGTYPPYDDGVDLDIFIKNNTGQIFVGKVWNSISTVFPDFTNPKVIEYWTTQFRNFHSVIPYDGAWIDMNEPSNFYDGTINGCPSNSTLEHPPYVPGELEPLYSKTLCMTAQQNLSDHYNLHNLYGITESIATNIALSSVLKKRPFIISRSTFPGIGRYSGHWDGDILSDWDYMKWTIPSIINLNMLGVPLIGADICGFELNTTSELCARWSALGAFYPFSRNHNSDDCIDQDPVALGETVVNAAKNALMKRYAMLPFLYTLFYRSHVYGETVVRALFFEFPEDRATYSIDTQFLWGPALMVIPTLQPGATSVTAYFPKGIWYEFTGIQRKSTGTNITLNSPVEEINLAIRGGFIIPVQAPNVTTTESRKQKFLLVAAPDINDEAVGELFWDDGDSIDTYETGQYNHITFKMGKIGLSSTANVLATTVDQKGYDTEMNLDTILILGVSKEPNNVKLNGKTVSVTYDSQLKLFTANDLGASLLEPFQLTWE